MIVVSGFKLNEKIYVINLWQKLSTPDWGFKLIPATVSAALGWVLSLVLQSSQRSCTYMGLPMFQHH